jgi:hypothetical protein
MQRPPKRKKQATENTAKTPPKKHKSNDAKEEQAIAETRFSIRPTVEFLVAQGIPTDDLLIMQILPFLTPAEIKNIGLTSKHNSFFRNTEQLRQLVSLVAKYEFNQAALTSNDSHLKKVFRQKIYLTIDGAKKPVKNPVLLMIYSLLLKDPSILTVSFPFVNPLNQVFNGSLAAYICFTNNFMLKQLVSQLIPGGAQAIANSMAYFIDAESKYDILLMPELRADQTLKDIHYENFIIFPEATALPLSIPEHDILLKKLGHRLNSYRMTEGQLMLDKSITLPAPDEQRNTIASIDPDEVLQHATQQILQAVTAITQPVLIIPTEEPQLFELLRLQCNYSIPLPQYPALIKQYDEHNNMVITQWGRINGKMQATKLSYQLHLTAEDEFSISSPPPIQDGVVLVYRGETLPYYSAINMRDYAVYYVEEGFWLDNNGRLYMQSLHNVNAEQIRDHQFELISELLSRVDKHHPAHFFKDLTFPQHNEAAVLMTSDLITQEQYTCLERGQSVCYDLRDYLRGITAFYQKYPIDDPIEPDATPQAERDWHKMVGEKQLAMPPWLAQLWCTPAAFYPIPDFANLMLQTKTTRLYLEGNAPEDFFYAENAAGAITKADSLDAMRSGPLDTSTGLAPDAVHPDVSLSAQDIHEIHDRLSALPEEVMDDIENESEVEAETDDEMEEEVSWLAENNIFDLWAMLSVKRLIDQSYLQSKQLYFADKLAALSRPNTR